ncbi:MAG: hypothetical protein Q8O84_03915 [Nanoarchaeota archaeon]|nr:hypothetical protein [Nanoarchaeota archaeon]
MKKLAIIFVLIVLISIAFVSAHYNSEKDFNNDGKVSFGEWMKNIFGKITGNQILQKREAELACLDGATKPCGTDVGECAKGTSTCSNGAWGVCVGETISIIEICGDGKDQDCNGGDLACPTTTCTDTDFGLNNFTILGSASNSSITIGDSCINSTSLNESFCAGNNVNFEIFNCKTLGASYGCQGGVCSCISNYTLSLSSCDSAKDFVNFTDLNACASSYTAPYDCDGNGVISKPSCISTNADVTIDLLPFDNSMNYSGAGSQIVQVAEGYQGVEFDWNFSASEKLDFCDIKIKTSNPATDKFGYVLFNSSEEISDKIVYVDKLNSSSGAVCIKDIPGVVSVNEFSANCSASDEVLVKCPSPVNSTYNCDISEDNLTFIVWPLNHSAVKEMLSITGLVSLGGTDDFNNFTNQTGTGETEETGCNPQWTCANFGKCVDGFKERTCTDSNNCGVEIGKPSETSECKTKSTLFIILGIVGLILIIFLIMYFMKKGKSEEEPSEEPQFTHQTSPPRSPPSPPQNRAVHYKPQTQLAPQR